MGAYLMHYKINNNNNNNKVEQIDQEQRGGEEKMNKDAVKLRGGGESPRSPAIRPAWLEKLLWSEFFWPCEEHGELKKSEINIFCLDCRRCLCSHCINPESAREMSNAAAAAAAASPTAAAAVLPAGPHEGHQFLQIRRYIYQNVIRLQDIEKLLNCTLVQTYVVNGAKAVLLQPKTKSKPSKFSTHVPTCKICRRFVAPPNLFCSMACKVAEWSDDGGIVASGQSDMSAELGDPSEQSPLVPRLTLDVEDSPPSSAASGGGGGSGSHCIFPRRPEEDTWKRIRRRMRATVDVQSMRKHPRKSSAPRRSHLK